MRKTSPQLIPSELLSPSPEFTQAMESMDMHWWNWNVVESYMTISPTLKTLLGYNEDDFDPSIPTLDRNIHQDDAAANLLEFRKLIQGETEFYEMEYRLKVKGEWRWYYNRGTVVARDREGRPQLIGGITMNMSGGFKRMISRIEEGKKFEFVFKHTTEPVFIIDYSGRKELGKLVDFNAAASKLVRMEPEEIIGKDISDIVGTVLNSAKGQLEDELSQKGYVHFESVYTDRFDDEKYLEFNAHAFTLTGKDLVIAIVNDKSESHLAKKDLKSSENLYKQLIQSADDRIGLYDTEGNIVIINSAYSRALGFTDDEFKGINDTERIHPDDKERIDLEMKDFLKVGYKYIEYRIQHNLGHYLHMSAKVMLLKGEDVGRDYILHIIRDITSEKEFQKELVDAKERAEESDMLKSAFLANMSHEIRTPMNSIVGFSNLLTDPDIDKESRSEYVKRINKNSDQLLTLISDIIDLSKIESNQMTISFSPIMLSTLFKDILTYGEFQISTRSKSGLELEFDPDPDHPEICMESDLVRLTQVLQNLLNNAIKFTGEGKITAGYRLVQDDMVQFFVRDTGVGIDEKNFEIIFDQFRQIDGSHTRTYGGTGLGLAISRNLVRMLGGKIWVESVKGEGASFFMELPLKGEFNLVHVVENRDKDRKSLKNDFNILIADDDEDSVKLLSAMLKAEGIQVISADSGYRALQIMETEQIPDMVILDLQMPVLNGKHTMKIIKEVYPDIRVIAQSAHAIDGAKAEFISMGFDDYFAKPFRKDEIMEVITKHSSCTKLDS